MLSGGAWNQGGGSSLTDGKYAYANRFYIINSGTTGSLPIPANAEIVEAGFPSGLDAVATTVDGGKYTSQSPLTTTGAIVGADIDTLGNWSLSAVPSVYPVAIIYRTRTLWADFDPDEANIVGDFEVNYPDFSGTPNTAVRSDGNGRLASVLNIEIQSNGFTDSDFIAELTGLSGALDIHRNNISLNASIASPNQGYILYNNQASVDSSFDIGESTQAFRFTVNNIVNNDNVDIGQIEFIQNNFSIGNGTDPIESMGIAYMMGFGTFNSGVEIKGPLQGYGFQMAIQAGATFDPATYSQAFYDNAQYNCVMPGHTSYNASPFIEEISSGRSYQGLSVNPEINTVQSNSGISCVSVGGNIGTFAANSYYHGINVNPNIDSARYAAGINVTMDNVTVYAGVIASVVIQDLTFAADLPGSGANAVTIAFVDDGTAGAETISQTGLDFVCHMEDGVSTAQNIADAFNAFVNFTNNANVTISGTPTNTQVAQAATNLSGGIDPGTKQAAYLDGNVEITGNLSFGGALSIGKLNSFFSEPMVDGGGNPLTTHTLISNPTVASSTTLTTADYLGVNTAMLLSIGDNATVGTAFIGISAMGLPAVVNMGTGSTVDQVAGGTFAVSLDAAAGGGTIDRLDLCRSIALPNGITTINNLRGYKFDLPFGDPGTKTHGFYEQPGVNNYFAGNLLIGGTPSSDDTVTNSNVALEIKSTTKAAVLSRMTTTQRNAMTAINGMMIYNTTDNKFQGYANGSWVDFH